MTIMRNLLLLSVIVLLYGCRPTQATAPLIQPKEHEELSRSWMTNRPIYGTIVAGETEIHFKTNNDIIVVVPKDVDTNELYSAIWFWATDGGNLTIHHKEQPEQSHESTKDIRNPHGK